MTRTDAINHFGSQAALAKALGIGRASVNGWGEEIPIGRQFQIEVLTDGVLKADRRPVRADVAEAQAA